MLVVVVMSDVKVDEGYDAMPIDTDEVGIYWVTLEVEGRVGYRADNSTNMTEENSAQYGRK